MQLYVLTNRVNGKRYVGQTVGTLARRFASHKRSPQPIGHAIRKYGWDSFSIDTIQANSLDNLNALEELAIKVLGSRYTRHGYNIKRGGNNQTGQVCSDEQKALLREKYKGKKRPKSVGKKISAGLKGKKFSQERRDRMSVDRTGNKHTKEARAKISTANTGRVVSAETRAKISAANSGKKRTPEMNEANRQRQLGRKHSRETRAKMSASRKGKKMPPRTGEWRKKQSEMHKGVPWSAARREAHERRYG